MNIYNVMLTCCVAEQHQRTFKDSLPYFLGSQVTVEFLGVRDISVTSKEKLSYTDVAQRCEELATTVSTTLALEGDSMISESGLATNLRENDPYEYLIENGQIMQTGRGQFVYSGDFLVLFDAVDAILKEYCITVGAVPQLYPTLVETSKLADAGYFSSFPHNAIFAAPCKLDRSALKRVADVQPKEEENLSGCLASPNYVLAPTVCYHCFSALSQSEVASKSFTALNKCHRNEVSEVQGLERLTTFWMRELITFGSTDHVTNQLSSALQFSCELLEAMDVSYRIYRASDPFFADYANKSTYQNALNLKQEIKLPISNQKHIAVASFNNHLTSLTTKFKITSPPEEGHSGCVGWGFERLLYGLFWQFGPKLAAWPKQARKALQL